MGFVALDDAPEVTSAAAPSGFTPLDDDSAPKGFTPLDEGAPELQPEGAFTSALRSGLSGILPAIGTAAGAVGAGALATPETVGIGTIPAAIAGGAAGGYAGKKLQNAILGDYAKQNEAQLAVNAKAHNIASGAGEIIPTLVSMAGGGGVAPKLLGIGERAIAAAGLKAGTAEAEQVAAKAIEEASKGFGGDAIALRSAESALGGARLGASQTAQEDNPTIQDFADNIAKNAVQFGPLGILPHADTLAKTLGYSVPQAALTTLSGAAYDALAHGKSMDYQQIKDQGLANVIPFALFNAVSHGVGLAGKLAPKPVEPPHALDPVIDSNVEAGNPLTAQALAQNKAKSEEAIGARADVFAPTENENVNPANAGQAVEGQQESPAPIETQPEVSQEPPPEVQNPKILEENDTLRESGAGNVLERQPEEIGEAGSERGGVEQSQQGPIPPEESQIPPPQGENAQNGGDVAEEFSAKNAAVNDLLAKNDLPAAEKLASRNLTEEGAQADARYKADPASSFASADALVQRQLDDPQHQITPAEQAVFAAHGRALDAGLTHLAERSTDKTITPEERESARVQYLALRDKLSEYGQANTFAGTQPALVLRARQIEKAKDMTLGRLLADMSAIKGDKGITPEEDAKIREIAKRDADLQKQKAEAAAKESKSDLVNETDATRKAVEKDVRRGKKKRLTTDQKKNLLDTIFGRKPKGEDNQIQSSTPSDEGGAPVVTIQHSNAAVENLKKTEAGRKILSDAIIVPDWQRVIAHPAFDGRNFSTSERETIKRSEGFFDPQTGKSVVIRDNIRPKNGESPQRAVQRVLIHERVGHDGLTALRGLDPKFDKQWHDITSKIPQAELDEIGKTYSKLDRDGLINEWFARKFEALNPNEIPNPSTPFGRMWQMVKDLLAKIFGQSSKLDQQVRDLFRAAIHSSQAMESRRGFGDVMASLPEDEKSEEKVPSSIHEVPKSVLDRLMYEHVASGSLDPGERGVQELTNRMRADLEPYLGPIPEDEMQKAIVDYGKKVYPTKDEVAKEVSQRKQEILLGQQVKEAKGGIIPALRALRQKGTQHARDLLKELNEVIADKKLSRKSDEEQRATRLDAKMSRVNNSIQDVEKQIADLKDFRPPKDRKLPPIEGEPDQMAKLAEAEEKLKGLRADRDQIVKDRLQPAPEPGDYFQKISKQVEASEKRIKELTAKNESGDLSIDESEKGPTHPLLEEKRDQIKALNKELAAKRAEAERPAREQAAAEKEFADIRQRIADKEAKLAPGGDLSKDSIKHRAVSSELARERENLADVNKRIAKARSDAEKPQRDLDRLQREIRETEMLAVGLEAKVKRGDLEPIGGKKSSKVVHPDLQAARDRVAQANKELADKRAARDKPARDAEKAQNDLDDAEAKVIQLEAKLQSDDISKTPVKRKAVSDELQAVRDQIKGLNKGISDARKDAEKPAREAKAAAKELQDAKDKVSELEGKLTRGEIAPQERIKRTIPAELQAERDKLSELNKEKADAWRELNSNTPITEEAAKKAVDSLLKRKQDRLKELQDFNRGIESGETPQRPAKRIPLKNRESERLDTEIKRNRKKKEDYFRKKEYAERPTAQKFWDGVVKMKRALVLSSYGVFGKLAAAAHIRALLMGIEDLMGGGLEKVLPKGVTSKARIESGSSVSAMANAAYEALTQGMKDAVKTIKTGQSDLDIQHGKLKGLDEGVSSWLGRLHGAVKAPIKRAAYEYAYKKQFENYGKHDPAALDDPMTQLKIQADAYKYANRAIFMQDNAITKSFSLFLNNLHQQGGEAAGIARALRVLLPIVKVPTNIAHEVYLNAFGVPLGLAKLGKAWKAGFDNLSTEEADMILSHLKKGSIGGAVMLMGFFNPQIAGGYYQRGIKRKDSDPEYGGFKIGDVKVPRWMTHAPAFEAMQIGATMRRVADSRLHGEKRGMTSGALAGLFGLASEVPFVNEMVKAGDLQSPEGREKWLGEVAASQVVPAAVSQYARQTDVDASGNPIKRKEESFKDVFKSTIPGQREALPVQKQKKVS